MRGMFRDFIQELIEHKNFLSFPLIYFSFITSYVVLQYTLLHAISR